VGENKPLKFIFITPFVDYGFFTPVKQGIHDASGQLGVQTDFVGTIDNNLDELEELLNKAINDSYDGIVLNISHPTRFNSAINKAGEKGIPILTFNMDTKDPTSKRLSAVCQNFHEAGKTVGRECLHVLKENSKVLMTLHAEGVPALDERLAGEQEMLKQKNIEWKVIVTGDDSKEASIMIKEILTNDQDISAIICTGQADTEGAGYAAAASEFADRSLFIAGFDLTPTILNFIEAGIIHFTVDQQPYVQGYYPVLQLVQLCRLGIHPSHIDTGTALINKANIKSVLELSRLGYR